MQPTQTQFITGIDGHDFIKGRPTLMDGHDFITTTTSTSSSSLYPASHTTHENHHNKIRNKKMDSQLKRVVSYVNAGDIRPVLPLEDFPDNRTLGVGVRVDFFSEGCWRKGTITGVFEDSRYLVVVDDQREAPVVLSESNLRVQSWISPLNPVQKDSFQTEVNATGAQSQTQQERWLDAKSMPGRIGEVKTNYSGKRMKLRIKYAKKQLEAKFSPGTTVEVKSDEDGYEGAWYTATIVGSAGVGKFLVEYQTLKTDDENELLKEVANEVDIRPCPPETPQSYRYKLLQEVDAWYNDGWWEGVISEVLGDWKYVVYFASTNEKLVYQHSNLRPHQNWVDGKWFLPSPKSRTDLKFAAEEENFTEGKAVEVRSDKEGYQGSWYTATIISFISKDKFLVEYVSLKTNDNSQPLREEVSAIDVRPSPPWILHVGRYKHLEKVDAWYDGGWWVGVISEVLSSMKYIVYFASTGDQRECDHINLRPHQDWIDGKWIIYKKRPSELKLTAKPSKRNSGRSKSCGNFGKGTMVEVKSDEQGYEGSWYSAVIVKSKTKGRFVVEYLTLKTEDERKLLREEIDARNIRPCPPEIKVDDRYHLLEKVDAWYNDGWWVGVISKVLAVAKYMVYFKMSKEEMEFDHVNLRTHQEWINGEWISTNKDKPIF